jgi:2-succinyl-6-hydroxy-2,4-cyclohexadiene-1-carboxylate synthase
MILHAEVSGDGMPLVLLHGFTGSVATWEPARAVIGTRHRLIAVDLPGHGRSPMPAPCCRLPAVADALVAVLDRLGVERAAWLGYSLGARAALHVALAHPARVERLVLEGASPGIADAGERRARAADDETRAARLERDGLASFVAHWMAQPLLASQHRLDPAVLARERAIRLRQTAAGLAAALRTMGAGTQAPLWERLTTLRPPTLLVAGADDERYAGLAVGMAAVLPDARVAVVPEAGHNVHLENPIPFWSLVCRFLARDRAAPREGAFA